MKTVLTSAHFAGREQVAVEMLDSNLTAERIVSMLAKAPRREAANAMLAGLAATPNPDLGPGYEASGSGSANPDVIWDRARASNLADITPERPKA
ncbi:hypothetical protein ACFSGX_07840 [Sphingomonas arantia]|uniref:Uncharacterized protein n=2 Tax=Sphingomonas arantia TaxID=1460676 RepID=A0ABW4TXG3_9SPHN